MPCLNSCGRHAPVRRWCFRRIGATADTGRRFLPWQDHQPARSASRPAAATTSMRACWRRTSPPHPRQSADRDQEHAGRQWHPGRVLHDHAHTAGRHLARRSSSTPRPSARSWAARATSIRSSSSGSAASSRPRPSRWSGTPRRVQSVEEAKHKRDPDRRHGAVQQLLLHPDRAQRPDRHQIQGDPRLPRLADQALAMVRGEVNAIGGMSWEAIQTNHHGLAGREQDQGALYAGRAAHQGAAGRPGLLDFAVDERSRNILGAARQRTRHRPLDRRRARHSSRARRRLAQGLHGDDGGSRIRRRDAQAQPRTSSR